MDELEPNEENKFNDYRDRLPKMTYIIRTQDGRVFFPPAVIFTRVKATTQMTLRRLYKEGVLDKDEWDRQLKKLNAVLANFKDRFLEMKHQYAVFPYYRSKEYFSLFRKKKRDQSKEKAL